MDKPMFRTMSIPPSPLIAARTQSFIGLAIWCAAIAIVQPGWAPALLLFGPLVLYPILFELVATPSTVRWLALACFTPVVVSYGVEQGTIACALTLPWLAFTICFLGHRFFHDLLARNYAL